MNKSKRIINLHIYPSDITHQARIQKEIKSLFDLKLVEELIIISQNLGTKPPIEKVSSKLTLHNISLLTSKDSNVFLRRFMFIEFFIRAFFKTLTLKFDIINCHSLHVLPLGVAAKILRSKKLIYDAHELETEVNGAKGMLKVISKVLEKTFIKFVDQTFVVSNSIKEWYINKYQLKDISTIRNIPSSSQGYVSKNNLLRNLFHISENQQVYIYQGSLSTKRGANIILEAFKSIHSIEKHIVFLGSGHLKNEILEATKIYNNIHFLDAVSTVELPAYTSSADVGIHMIINTCLNHYYCLPNKIFEYFVYGIPVIVSDFPEMSSIVESNNIGWCISPQIETLVKVINSITNEEIEKYRSNVLIKRNDFSWENEANEYINAYQRVSK